MVPAYVNGSIVGRGWVTVDCDSLFVFEAIDREGRLSVDESRVPTRVVGRVVDRSGAGDVWIEQVGV